jgi:hypothetical protein
MRVFLILALAWVSVASAETLACLTTFQGYRVCQGPDGYRSIEIEWMGFTTGRDNRGDDWTSSTWNGLETTTVRRRP